MVTSHARIGICIMHKLRKRSTGQTNHVSWMGHVIAKKWCYFNYAVI